ncbi:MAG: ABC transporter substrate-binding protein [Rhodospirillaceae bacterium]|nr:ABC transporter substrate-binding protein [Rhodospirillaceae bacterium]|tara:strand:+ start:2349 stop:3278 length:930 start_codon:yes stop_codon:yes gene_type:complete
MSDITNIRVIEFPSTGLLPHYVAMELGFFEEQKVKVDITATPNSVFQITNLIDGNFEVAGTAIDNVVAYQEGQGVAKLSRAPDLFGFMGASQVNLGLVVQSHINKYEDLKNTSLAVDALSTGFAFMLREMLEINGIDHDSYELIPVGATKARLDSLISGEHSGALLNPPFTEFAEAAGLKIIDNSQSALPTCQIGVMAACRGWAKENPEALRGFIKAELQAIEWISNQENSDSATKILLNKIPGMDIKAAEAAMQIMLDPIQGIAESEKINMEGVKTILDLRSKFGEPKKELNNPELYIDLTYYDSARD